MTDQHDPTSEGFTPAVPAQPAPAPPPAPSAPRPTGPSLGHVVLGAVLVLVGVGWLLEALDVANVPWRYLLPAVLIVVGIALVLGARTGRHSGLVALGIVLTVLVLLAGAIEVVMDVPLAGGVGDQTHRPTTTVAEEYRWGVGKMTLDLSGAHDLAGRKIDASVVIGELVVIVPDDLALVITARAGLGEVNVLGTTASGADPSLECSGSSVDIDCAGQAAGERRVELNLQVALGRVEVRR